MIIRRTIQSDLDDVSALLKSSFSPEVSPYMAYAQHGIGEFLSIKLSHTASFPCETFISAVDEVGKVLGFAVLRELRAKQGFVSYICVDPSARRRGVATRLLAEFCNLNPSIVDVSLDVFADNAGARALYSRLGFEQTNTYKWIHRQIPPCLTQQPISDATTAHAAHMAYGFCELIIKSEGEDLRFGRIGDDVIRCFDPHTFYDDGVLGRLGATFPTLTRAVAICAADTPYYDVDTTSVLVESYRMQGHAAAIRQAGGCA